MKPIQVGITLMVVCLLGLVACNGSEPVSAPSPESADAIEVSSPHLEDGGEFPVEFTCDGEDASPAIRWSRVDNTEEYLLVMTDPDAPGGVFVHWKLLGIDPGRSSVGRNQPPSEAVEGINSFGQTGYAGPCPPEGSDAHTYEITVYALNRDLELAPDVELRELLGQIECCLEASGDLEAAYGR